MAGLRRVVRSRDYAARDRAAATPLRAGRRAIALARRTRGARDAARGAHARRIATRPAMHVSISAGARAREVVGVGSSTHSCMMPTM